MLGWIGYGFTSLRNAIMSTATQKLRGKVAVITGGLGLATEIRRRRRVLSSSRREDALDAAVTQTGRNVSDVQGNVSDLDDFDRSIAPSPQKRHGRLDGSSRAYR
jgi:NAD(P)-dependent dehydrogenase (short-subunit alcohol dehydrogenase family)